MISLLSLFILTNEIEKKRKSKKYSIKRRKNSIMMTPTFPKKLEKN